MERGCVSAGMRHLLVPLDGSDLAASVVPVARTLAVATGATVRLVTVEPQATPLGSARAAAAYLDGIAESLRRANVSVQTNVRVGEPALRSEERRVGKECRSRW